MNQQQPVWVVILAAGLGTRMKSNWAKVLHRAGGLPLIEHVVRTAIQLVPPDQVYVVVGYQGDRVREAVSSYGVRFAVQTEPRGTADAVASTRSFLANCDGLLIVLYGDTPLLGPATLRRLLAHHQQSRPAATLLTMTLDDPTGYGRILTHPDGSVRAIVEERAATAEQRRIRRVNTGIYCFDNRKLWQFIHRIQPNNPAGEYYLTDIVELFDSAGLPVHAVELEDPTEALGINTRIDLARVDRILRERKAKELMLAGVTIEYPETVRIDVDVQVGQDTRIGPFAQLLGKTVVYEDVEIGAGTIVKDCWIGRGAMIHPYCVLADSRVEAGAIIGPFARLRMNCYIGTGAAIGNFVEMKNTRFGPGSKAMHLAYLGDAEVGAEVNIGAGTITCNYDGVRKHPTFIRDRAFVGSNVTLIAPVEVGPGSYIGAGSVITDPVPADALGLGRARQIVKEGWAKRRREQQAASATPNTNLEPPEGCSTQHT